jgi:hypothetical protein
MCITTRSRDIPKSLLRIAATLVLLAASRCNEADAILPEHPERLHGEWTMEFRLEHAATLTRDTAGMTIANSASSGIASRERFRWSVEVDARQVQGRANRPASDPTRSGKAPAPARTRILTFRARACTMCWLPPPRAATPGMALHAVRS